MKNILVILAVSFASFTAFAGGGGASKICPDGSDPGWGRCPGEHRNVYHCVYSGKGISDVKISQTSYENYPKSNYGVAKVYSEKFFPTLHYNRATMPSQSITDTQIRISSAEKGVDMFVDVRSGWMLGAIKGTNVTHGGVCELISSY
ncbi:MAG: hypothetical protein V4736_04300 [Bdellovibrionota bacterium]